MSKPRCNRRPARWLIPLILVVVALCAVQMTEKITHLSQLNRQADECRLRLAQAQALYDEKMETIELLDNPDYIQRVARESLGMVKQGETIVSVVKIEEEAAPQPQNLPGSEAPPQLRE